MIESEEDHISGPRIIATNFSYRGYTLVSVSLVLFEILFLILYIDSFWLAFDLLPWGVVAIVLSVCSAHFLLLAFESKYLCRLLTPLLNGRPPIIYRQWLTVDDSGITFGVKRLLFDAIEEASLGFLGNLALKSRCLSGAETVVEGKDINPAEIVMRVPFGALDLKAQRQFIELLKHKKNGILFDGRLQRHLKEPYIAVANWLKGFTVVFLCCVLMDFGYSEFWYLTLLKEYFLANQQTFGGAVVGTAIGADSDAVAHFEKAEQIRQHPLSISWISANVMNRGAIAAHLQQARSEALWSLGRKPEAIAAALESAKESPRGFVQRLRLARLYAQTLQPTLAKNEINKVIEDHKDALVPRLYLLALLLADNKESEAKDFWKQYEDELNEKIFSSEPAWPPGGEPFLHELFYKDDLDFLFKKPLGEGHFAH